MKSKRKSTDWSARGALAMSAKAPTVPLSFKWPKIKPLSRRFGDICKRGGLRSSLIGLLFFALCFSVAAQKKTPVNSLLANFEKSIEQGRLAETERPLLDYALANPQNVEALELVGRLRLRQGRLEEAKALYRRVLTLDPKLASAKINYGIILFETGETDEARRVLSEINQAEIVNPAARLNLAKALTLVGEFQKSLAVIENLPTSAKNSEALPVLAVCYLKLGERAKLDTLIPLAKKAVVSKPGAALRFAEVLMTAGMNQPAIELLRALTTASPKNVPALILLAQAEIYAKNFTGARSLLNRAAMLQPPSAEVLFTQAMLEKAQGNASAALDLLNKALSLSPNSTAVLSEIVIAAMRANQARKAVEAAEKLLVLNRNEPEFLYLHGAASLQNGNTDAAQKSLESYMQARPEDSRGCLALGLALAARRDQIERARQQLWHCLEINPANFEARYQLGLSYKAQGDTAKAIQLLEETVAAAPDYPLALRDLGTVYLQAGEEAKARIVLEKAVTLDPNDSETHFQLSRLYNLIGEPALAKKHLDLFQKLRNAGGNSM
jgi:cellulose synthase operon protein C